MNPSDDPSNRLIDSLLQQQARGGADEELLKAIETKLDAASPAAPRKPKNKAARWTSLAAAAAVICGGVGVYVYSQRELRALPELAEARSSAKSASADRSVVERPMELELPALPPEQVSPQAEAEMAAAASGAKVEAAPAAPSPVQVPDPSSQLAQLEKSASPNFEYSSDSLPSPSAAGNGAGGRGVGRGSGLGAGDGSAVASGVNRGPSPAPARAATADKSIAFADGERITGMRAPSADALPAEKSPVAEMAKKARTRVADEDGMSRDNYSQLVDQPWKSPWQDALSTFSIDVDTASYTNLRRMILEGRPVPRDAVRIEECVNYFDYKYAGPQGDGPFAVHGNLATCPWKEDHLLARVAIKGKEIPNNARPASNLVFLIDVSGSMQSPDKLPLLKRSMRLLVDQLDERDRVAMVVYAGTEGVALDSTVLDERGKSAAIQALEKLEAGGSTNGGAGIKRAYDLAKKHFIQGATNRVILATDGDFNVGITSQGDLVNLVKERAAGGVYLSVLGFGTGNFNEAMLQAVTKDGNGTCYYVDSDEEARRIFLQKLGGTLVTIAKDVKIQVEFNPGKVQAYRLIGYADRILRHEDFNNDKVDAGDIGAGHTVTAFYEIVPNGVPMPGTGTTDPLRYQKPPGKEAVASEDWFTLKLRHKHPEGDTSALIETPVKGEPAAWQDAGNDFRFASAVALFGMKLRQMSDVADVPWANIEAIAKPALAEDPREQRAAFIEMLRKYGKYPVSEVVSLENKAKARDAAVTGEKLPEPEANPGKLPEVFKHWGFLREETTQWYVTFGLESEGTWAPKLVAVEPGGKRVENKVPAANMLSPGDTFFRDGRMADRFKFNGIVKQEVMSRRTNSVEEVSVAIFEDLKPNKKGLKYESQYGLPEPEIPSHAYYDRSAIFSIKGPAAGEPVELKVEELTDFALPPGSGKKEFFLKEIANDYVIVVHTDAAGVKTTYKIGK